jgi:O-antigen/teichoic acid export membrane protein
VSSPGGHEPVDVLDTTAAGRAAIRGGALRGSGYGLGLLLSAASVPFVVRHLGLADFGQFVLITALITLVGGLTEVGLQAVGTREYTVRTGADRDRLMSNLLGVRVALTTLGVAGAIAFTLVVGYDRTLVLGTVLAGAALLVQSVQTLLAVPLIARLRLGWATVAELLRQSVTVALTLALVVAGAELLPFFAVAIPGAAASAILTAFLVRRLTPFRPNFDAAEWWALLRDTIAYAIAIAMNVAYFRIAIVIMSLMATELETGYFAASFRVLEVLLPIPALVVGGAFPILARAARDDLHRLAYASQRVFDVALIAGGGLVLILELGAPVVVDILAGEAGDPVVPVLRIQAPALIATFLAVGAGFSLLSLRRHREVLVANVVALILSVALAVALIPPLGAEGAALATTVAEWGLALVTVGLLVRSLPELDLSPRVAGPVLLAGAAGGSMLLAPVSVVVQTVLGAGLYVGVLFALRSVPRELIDALPSRRAT